VVEVGGRLIFMGMKSDPHRLATVEERLRELNRFVASGPTLKEAIAYYQRIQAELQELNAGESIAALEQHERVS